MQSKVEQYYLEKSGRELFYKPTEKIPIIQVDNFPELGKLTALRFVEWVQQNPDGVISLPTGKTPEHFIKWVAHIIKNWETEEVQNKLKKVRIDNKKRPVLDKLRFVQIDEFYPIDSSQHNSFYYYIQKYYINNLGLNKELAQFINVNEIGTAENLSLDEIFPDKVVDLSLRTRFASTTQERLQKETIEIVDEFCTNYEKRIRELGGIGFFLGGIGPDGHIGFNVMGSDHYSSTRLIQTNYETQAAAATDLGGIEIARDRLVITIGLETITHNKDAVAIIIAAGEAKANIVRDSIENSQTNHYPATVVQNLKNARFYLTNGSALRLLERRYRDVEKEKNISQKAIERAVINLCVAKNKSLLKLTEEDFNSDRFAKLVLNKTNKTAEEIGKTIYDEIIKRFEYGMKYFDNEVILHSGPHHDDIILGYLPLINHLVRNPNNQHYFATLTSGFTAVTNSYMLEQMIELKNHLSTDKFKTKFSQGYFDPSFMEGKNKDVNLYLDGVGGHHKTIRQNALCRRLLRDLIEIYNDMDIQSLEARVDELINYFSTQYPGKKDITDVQELKGMLREFEEEIVWGHFGFNCSSVPHLRLGFYQGEIFTENPEINRDVLPIVKLLKKVNPTIVTVALDPEGSGPDTHYKVLQATSEALKIYEKETSNSNIKVWGYRNVWYRFHPAEANVYVPVSLNSFAILEDTFMRSYGSQKSASFPSYEYDGPFSRLAQRIQVEQYQTIRTCLGKDYFLTHDVPRVRAAHGMVYLKELNLQEFYKQSMELKKLTENL